MGVGVPAAIGAKAANPDQLVAAFIGEGGLMMCLEELHTIVSESLDITVFVFNNNDYAIISEEAERAFDLDRREYGWANAPLDCTAIVDGMGMRTERAETPDEIVETARFALNAGPPLVEIPMDSYELRAGQLMKTEITTTPTWYSRISTCGM